MDRWISIMGRPVPSRCPWSCLLCVPLLLLLLLLVVVVGPCLDSTDRYRRPHPTTNVSWRR